MEWTDSSFEGFLNCIPEHKFNKFVSDCEKCFSCTSVEKKSNYSDGQTYFQSCDAAPTNALEAFASSVFDFHSRNVKEFDRKYVHLFKHYFHYSTQIFRINDQKIRSRVVDTSY